jgi:hypothetical protein
MSYLSSAYATGRVGQETQRRHPADSRGERRICLERLLGLYNRAHRTSRDLRLLVDQPLGRRQGPKVVTGADHPLARAGNVVNRSMAGGNIVSSMALSKPRCRISSGARERERRTRRWRSRSSALTTPPPPPPPPEPCVESNSLPVPPAPPVPPVPVVPTPPHADLRRRTRVVCQQDSNARGALE